MTNKPKLKFTTYRSVNTCYSVKTKNVGVENRGNVSAGWASTYNRVWTRVTYTRYLVRRFLLKFDIQRASWSTTYVPSVQPGYFLDRILPFDTSRDVVGERGTGKESFTRKSLKYRMFQSHRWCFRASLRSNFCNDRRARRGSSRSCTICGRM